MPSDRYSPPVFQSADSGHAFKYPVLPIALNKADFPFPPPIVDINAKEINSQISLAVFITNQ